MTNKDLFLTCIVIFLICVVIGYIASGGKR